MSTAGSKLEAMLKLVVLATVAILRDNGLHFGRECASLLMLRNLTFRKGSDSWLDWIDQSRWHLVHLDGCSSSPANRRQSDFI